MDTDKSPCFIGESAVNGSFSISMICYSYEVDPGMLNGGSLFCQVLKSYWPAEVQSEANQEPKREADFQGSETQNHPRETKFKNTSET